MDENRIVITSSSVTGLAVNPVIVEAFPFLKHYAPGARRGCCGKAQPQQDGNKAIKALLLLPSERKKELKRLLGSDNVVVTVVKAGRVVLESL